MVGSAWWALSTATTWMYFQTSCRTGWMLSLSPSLTNLVDTSHHWCGCGWSYSISACAVCPPASLPMLPATCKAFTASTDLSCHIMSHDITVLTRLSYDALNILYTDANHPWSCWAWPDLSYTVGEGRGGWVSQFANRHQWTEWQNTGEVLEDNCQKIWIPNSNAAWVIPYSE